MLLILVIFSEFSSERAPKVSTWRCEQKPVAQLTVWNALEIEVCLGSGKVGTNPLPVDFVLDIAEQNEGRHDTGILGSLHPRLHSSIPQIRRRRQHSSDGAFAHGEQSIPLKNLRLPLANPIGLRRVA